MENCSAEKYFGSAWTGFTWSWIEKTWGFFEHRVGPSNSEMLRFSRLSSEYLAFQETLCRLELNNYWNVRTKS